MVAYSFKDRFIVPISLGLNIPYDVDHVVDVDAGPKRQTIRAIGLRRHARPGETLQLYHAQLMDTDRVAKILDAGFKLKSQMKKRGLTAARAKCPFCKDGFLHGRLVGRKDHLHMACDSCDVRSME
jgi:hypothetical protein